MTSSRLVTLPLLLLPVLLLAACSGTSAAGSGSGAQASAKAIASAVASAQGKTAAPAASGPITTGDQLCALVPVSGVGDLAGVNSLEFDAQKGQTVVSVESVGDVDLTTDQMIALGKLIVSRLP